MTRTSIRAWCALISTIAAIVSVLGFSAPSAGADADVLRGPVGTVITVTLPCADGKVSASFTASSSIQYGVSPTTGAFGTGFVNITVPSGTGPVSVVAGTALDIGQACVVNPGQTGGFRPGPLEVFCVTDGTPGFSCPGVGMATPGGSVSISPDGGGKVSAAASQTPAVAPPSGVSFPYGQLSFTIDGITPGATIPVVLALPAPATSYWKFQAGAWTQFSGATFFENRVVLTLTDGGAGDADGVANGQIVDPGAPATGAPAASDGSSQIVEPADPAASASSTTPRFTG